MDKTDWLKLDKYDAETGIIYSDHALLFLILNVFFMVSITGSFFLMKYGAKIEFDRF
jgi:hypothetical protein